MLDLKLSLTTAQRHLQLARSPKQQQRGVALFVVIVVVMLSMLLALWAARSSLFNEIIVGNDADYRRAFDAAQAMLQDAELDIRGVKPDGSVCTPVDDKGDVCRRTTTVYFDIETKDLADLLSTIQTNQSSTLCYKGICQKRTSAQDFWNDATTFAAMTATDVGATYGKFTGASASATGNPILKSSAEGNGGAWYWVEMMPYVDPNVSLLDSLPANSNVARFAPSRKKLFIYRITAIANGMKAGNQVVLQSTLSVQSAE